MSAGNSLASGSGLLTFALAGMFVAALTYVASRALGNWHATQVRGRRLRVLEGVPMGKDRQLWLVAVGKEVLVVGASAGGVQLVHRVDEGEASALLAHEPTLPSAVGTLGFAQLEASVRTNLERIRKRLAASEEKGHA